MKIESNMKIFWSLILCAGYVLLSNEIIAQKRPLGHSDATTWPLIVSSKISNDGQYVAYKVKSEKAGASLTVQDKKANWKKKIAGVDDDYLFTEDSKWLIYSLPNDSIGLLELGKSNLKYVSQVSDSFEIHTGGDGRWIACPIERCPT
jgi:hypothetical protein